MELLDIGLYTGQKGINMLQQTKPYAITDKYVHYDKRYEEIKQGSKKLYRFLNDKLYNPVKNNLYVIYDQSSNYISFFVKILQEHQSNVAAYIQHHYENVQVFIQDKWLRLDLNNDGRVSAEDLRKNIQDLYEFMISYDYYQKAHEIKSKLYKEAIKYMRKDLEEERQNEERHIEEDED